MPTAPDFSDSLGRYQKEIGAYSLLSAEEERELARRFRSGDLKCGHALVTANLRFVVKIANEYRSYGLKAADLVQEGNLGLLKAVQKFDPAREIRLISYAVWWIRAYVQNHILTNWSLVKIGTTQAQRKLFFSLARTRREIERLGPTDDAETRVNAIAKRLNVRASDVTEMQQRLGGHDLSLDQPMGDEDGEGHIAFLESDATGPLQQFEENEESGLIGARVKAALSRLDPRERFVIEQRAMLEDGMTLKELGAHFGFSRERARQLELRAFGKLKAELSSTMDELEGEAAFA